MQILIPSPSSIIHNSQCEFVQRSRWKPYQFSTSIAPLMEISLKFSNQPHPLEAASVETVPTPPAQELKRDWTTFICAKASMLYKENYFYKRIIENTTTSALKVIFFFKEFPQTHRKLVALFTLFC